MADTTTSRSHSRKRVERNPLFDAVIFPADEAHHPAAGGLYLFSKKREAGGSDDQNGGQNLSDQASRIRIDVGVRVLGSQEKCQQQGEYALGSRGGGWRDFHPCSLVFQPVYQWNSADRLQRVGGK